MPFRIRDTTAADAAAVSALLAQSYSVLLAEAYDAETLRRALPLITDAQPNLLTSGTYYAAEFRDGQIVGAGGWTKHSPTGRNETASNGNIRHFGTDPDHTGKGIGRALMERCLEEATAAGLQELNCYSTLNGEAFYQACGFKAVEPFPIDLPGGVIFPAVRMTRTL